VLPVLPYVHLVCCWGAYQGVCCINLVNQHGSEGQLEKAFAAEARRSVVVVTCARRLQKLDTRMLVPQSLPAH
jgi:hypothetical protein